MSDVYLPDYVQVEIEGNDRTEYVISYERHSSLCEIGDSFTIEFEPNYPTTINPYDSILIKERYGGSPTRVLRGYIIDITQSVDPGSFIITGLDKSTLLHDYFIYENITAHGESVDYWINYLAGLVGLDVTFEDTTPAFVPDETPLGFQTVGEAIARLERIAAYYVKYDSVDDVLKVFRLETAEPQITIDEAINAERNVGTEKTRNVVKVYGGFKYNIVTMQSSQIFASARTEMSELIADKTVVVSNPALRKLTYANIVAERILNVVNSVDDIQIYSLDGFYPDLQVGDVGNIDWHTAWTYEGSRVITSIDTKVDSNGAITDITFGEKCPRLSIQLPPSPVYVSMRQGGVGVSWDAGESFVPTIPGLTGNALHANSIAVNSYGQQMIVTDDGIYKRPSIAVTWSPQGELPAPTNESNDIPAPSGGDLSLIKVVDEPTKYGTFHVLTRNRNTLSGRYYIYTTTDLGTNWSSIQVRLPTISGPPFQYDVQVGDIEASVTNHIYYSVHAIPEIEIALNSVYIVDDDFNVGVLESGNDEVDWKLGFVGLDSVTPQIFSVPGARNIAFACLITYVGSPAFPTGRIYRTTDFGENWTLVYNEALHDEGHSADREHYDQWKSIGFNYGAGSNTWEVVFMIASYDGDGGFSRRQYELKAIKVTGDMTTTTTSEDESTIDFVPADYDPFGDDPTGFSVENKDWYLAGGPAGNPQTARSGQFYPNKSQVTYNTLGNNYAYAAFGFNHNQQGGADSGKNQVISAVTRYDFDSESFTIHATPTFKGYDTRTGESPICMIFASPDSSTCYSGYRYINNVPGDEFDWSQILVFNNSTELSEHTVDGSSDSYLLAGAPYTPSTVNGSDLGQVKYDGDYKVVSGVGGFSSANDAIVDVGNEAPPDLFGIGTTGGNRRWALLENQDTGVRSIFYTDVTNLSNVILEEDFIDVTNLGNRHHTDFRD